MSSEPCRHERAPQSHVDAFGVLGDAGSRFEPGEADPAWRQWARDEIRRLRDEVEWLGRLSEAYRMHLEARTSERNALAEKVRRVEALAEEWEADCGKYECYVCITNHTHAGAVRYALGNTTGEATCCSTCGGTERVDWAPGQIRDSEEDRQPCPDCVVGRDE